MVLGLNALILHFSDGLTTYILAWSQGIITGHDGGIDVSNVHEFRLFGLQILFAGLLNILRNRSMPVLAQVLGYDVHLIGDA